MKISTKGRYGLRAMIDMTLNIHQQPVSIKAISERQGISESYLEQVFSTLKKAGLVKAVRGSYGGYELAKQPEQITAGQILRVLEGSLAPVFCVDTECCKKEKNCPANPFWAGLNSRINDYVDGITLKQMAENADKQLNSL